MQDTIETLFELMGHCVQRCRDLKDALETERTALIFLKTEEVVEANAHKEAMLSKLVKARNELREHLLTHFNAKDSAELEQKLKEPVLSRFKLARNEWLAIWEQTRSTCEVSIMFINHSQENLRALGENLKKLFGDRPLYSSKGTKVEKTTHGRVVEAKY